MILIIGLGNPSQKYESTRHNIGFAAIDEIAARFHFPDFELEKKLFSQISKEQISEKEIILAKPQTFVNESGKAVKILNTRYKIQDTIVIHDDIDIPLGEIKIAKNRGAAGHKGVESIIRELKTQDFTRIRLGIKNNESRVKIAEKFVLEKFTEDEKEVVKNIIEKMPQIIETYLKQGLEKTMSEYNN